MSQEIRQCVIAGEPAALAGCLQTSLKDLVLKYVLSI